MKTKHFNKKLSLGKCTIAELRNDEMNNANGGMTPNSCASCVPVLSVCLICTGQPCATFTCTC